MQNLKGEMKVNNLNDFFFQIKKKEMWYMVVILRKGNIPSVQEVKVEMPSLGKLLIILIPKLIGVTVEDHLHLFSFFTLMLY